MRSQPYHPQPHPHLPHNEPPPNRTPTQTNTRRSVGGGQPIRNAYPHQQQAYKQQQSGNYQQQPQLPQVIRPRVGGVTNGTVWTGGPNNVVNQMPSNVNQFRPQDYKNRKASQDAATKGLDEEYRLKLATEGRGPSVTEWLRNIQKHIKDFGMDTVFWIMKNGNERNLLEEWGLVEYKDWIEDWRGELKQGIIQPMAISFLHVNMIFKSLS